MKKLHIPIISLFALVLLACICVSCVSAEDATQDAGLSGDTHHDVVLTAGCEVLSADNETGTGEVRFNWNLNPNGEYMTNMKMSVYKVNNRFGGADYVWLCDKEIAQGQLAGSFVKELDLNQEYVLRLTYDDQSGCRWG